MRSTIEHPRDEAMQISHTEVRRHPIWQRVLLHEHQVTKPRLRAATGALPIAYVAIAVIAAAIAGFAWASS